MEAGHDSHGGRAVAKRQRQQGHSAHVFRGVEIYQGKPILYSAGDFVDDYIVDRVERNDQSFIFLLHISGGTVRGLSLYPTLIEHFQARLAKGELARSIARKMRTLCSVLRTDAQWDPEEGCLRVPIGR